MLREFELPFKLYIDLASNEGLGASLHQRKAIDGEPREGVICYISRKLKDPEARCQKENRKHGEKYGLLQHIEEPKAPWETINMDWVTGLVPGGKENFNACLFIGDSSHHSQTDGLDARMIQKMEDIIRRFCAYGMQYKYQGGYTHECVKRLPECQLAHNTSQKSATRKSTSLVEKGWNPLIPVDHLEKNLLTIHPNAKDFHFM
ncbi:hypothetical protein O181_025694 [Austropuccinia psidii MF-1]|uniref:Uncharacterized protein n=1 Tax=Austropuccinia psidii MF-1 TaxID=1389203 RepID=A0A9Q3H0W7_9BASI|nr:hypothetical protein [Austropuccinia psidii MF-1]